MRVREKCANIVLQNKKNRLHLQPEFKLLSNEKRNSS